MKKKKNTLYILKIKNKMVGKKLSKIKNNKKLKKKKKKKKKKKTFSLPRVPDVVPIGAKE